MSRTRVAKLLAGYRDRAAVDMEALSACLIQGDERLTNPPLRAIGTEPFWGGEVGGTSLTYTTPEDPDGAPIAGLYAAGACASNIARDGKGYASGVQLGEELFHVCLAPAFKPAAGGLDDDHNGRCPREVRPGC